MQEFIGDEDVGEGNEKPSKHFVSTILYLLHNFNALERRVTLRRLLDHEDGRHYSSLKYQQLSAHDRYGLTPQKTGFFMVVIFCYIVFINVNKNCLNKLVYLTYQLYT
jgi:hypothetical protein